MCYIVQTDDETIVSPFDIFSSNYTKEDERIAETMFIDEIWSNSSFDFLQSKSNKSSCCKKESITFLYKLFQTAQFQRLLHQSILIFSNTLFRAAL